MRATAKASACVSFMADFEAYWKFSWSHRSCLTFTDPLNCHFLMTFQTEDISGPLIPFYRLLLLQFRHQLAWLPGPRLAVDEPIAAESQNVCLQLSSADNCCRGCIYSFSQKKKTSICPGMPKIMNLTQIIVKHFHLKFVICVSYVVVHLALAQSQLS